MSPVSRFTCEEVFRRLDDYVDRELSAEETRAVEEHLATCAACASEYAFEAGLLGQVRAKLRQIEVPDVLRERVARMLAAEQAEQEM